jgi:hypothetical protein
LPRIGIGAYAYPAKPRRGIMADQLRYDFPVVSDGEIGPPKRGEKRQERMFQLDEGMDWKKGDRGDKVGTIHLTHPKDDTPKTFNARFEFDDGDTVEYEGRIPGDGSWKGKERVRFRNGKGKGKFRDRDDEIDLETVNPKRWG